MMFDGKAGIWHGEKTSGTHAAHLDNKLLLPLARTDMFEDGITVNNVKSVVVKRKRSSRPNLHMTHARVRGENRFPVRQAHTGELVAIGIQLLEHVRFNSAIVGRSD